MKTFFPILALASCSIAFGGQHMESFDSFTGVTTKRFATTSEEFYRYGMGIVIRKVDGQVILSAGPRQGVVNCQKIPMLLKTSSGQVITLRETTELNHRFCTSVVNPEWLEGSIQVRIPMWQSVSIDGSMDTSTLDLDRLK
jgi:hypothetical protein